MDEALARVTERLIVQPASDVSPAAMSFLARRYPAAPSPMLHAALERALDAALRASAAESDARVRLRWLGAYSDASVLVADDALAALVSEQLPAALDELERLVRTVYEPGEGAVGHGPDGQVLLALSLAVAFDLSARLPYAMLAEELLQTTLRGPDATGHGGQLSLSTRCRVVQLCCRLAALHRDPDYAGRAVLARGARYDRDAASWLESLTFASTDLVTSDAAEYGLALLDHFALNVLPN